MVKKASDPDARTNRAGEDGPVRTLLSGEDSPAVLFRSLAFESDVDGAQTEDVSNSPLPTRERLRQQGLHLVLADAFIGCREVGL